MLRRLPSEIEKTGHLGSTISNGRTLGVLGLYYRLTGDDLWKEVGQKIVEGLRGIQRSPFWPGCERSGELSEVPANPWVVQGLSQFFKMTGYEPALELAGSAVERMKQAAWTAQGETMEGFLEASRKGKRPAMAPFGWGGAPGRRPHFHSTTIGLLATLEYAALRGDKQLMALVREGYEYAKLLGETTVGYFPERATHLWSSSIEDRADFRYETAEACQIADMIALGLKLTHLGQGDYWDDVDRWLRNQFIESQLTDIEWVYRMTEELPEMSHDPSFQTTERVPERNLGAFAGWPSVNDWYTGAPHTRNYYPDFPGQAIMHCCTGNAARTIYYAWQHILEQQKDKVRVNLLLNRASPWIDLHSHIPYEGRIAIQVKKACELSVRIPEWVSPAETSCAVNSLQRSPGWQGRYAELGRLKPGDAVEVTFGIDTRIEDISVQGGYYKIERKGNEVVAIDPAGRYNPFYQRTHYRAHSTRWRKVNRFLSDNLVAW